MGIPLGVLVDVVVDVVVVQVPRRRQGRHRRRLRPPRLPEGQDGGVGRLVQPGKD